MSPGFDKARAAFGLYAARQLDVPTSEVEVMPADEAVARTTRLGTLWRFTAFGPPMRFQGREGPRQQVAGWATDDGEVVTPDTDLARLLREAGLFGDDPPDPAELVEILLVPTIGTRKLFVNAYRGAPAPAYVRHEDGSIELSFVVQVLSRTPGPIPQRYELWRVAARSPDQATLEVEPWTPAR